MNAIQQGKAAKPAGEGRPRTAAVPNVEHSPISGQIWDMKYRLKAFDGAPVDGEVEDTWKRVATALAAPESDPSAWEGRFYRALEDYKFLPAGRILAGAGAERRVTLFNCFVMGEIPDDMGGIFAHLREAALTMQQGGGIGYDFSTLRPKGAPVHRVGADASGPLSFMDVWDAMCRTIMSAGSRRGAMMATMRCDHPDIEDFIAAKREPGRLRMFNLSVLVTDAFMQAVETGAEWNLQFDGIVYKTLPAAQLWDAIMEATYAYAEPGVIFIDRINQRNNLHYCETISATNPCGEEPLPPYGACLLGSINLARLVKEPFSDAAALDLEELDRLVAIAVRMMDNVVDISRFPLEEQRKEAHAKRRIGLGITGLGDALIMCGVRYGSDDAVELTERWMHALQRRAYLASVDLAREKGAFPLYDAEAYLAGETIRGLDQDVQDAIAEHGIRNALLTAVAPTGTISLFADNVSSGLEPVFSFTYSRQVLMPDGTKRQEEVSDYAYRLYRSMFCDGADPQTLPPAFVDAQQLTPDDHLVMQAAVQKHIDTSISKTINVPESIDFEDFKNVYRQAYELGCKGCTTYRPNDITGAVLEVNKEGGADDADRPTEPAEVVSLTEPMKRAFEVPGHTYKLKLPSSDHATYLTINDVEVHGRRVPFEIFINSKHMEHFQWATALTRMISAVFRRGGDVAFVVEELKSVFDPAGGEWARLEWDTRMRSYPGFVAVIGYAIEYHLRRIGYLEADEGIADIPEGASVELANTGTDGAPPALPGATACPKCQQRTFVAQSGCKTCLSCGHSNCN